jgi:hypothetical protein
MSASHQAIAIKSSLQNLCSKFFELFIRRLDSTAMTSYLPQRTRISSAPFARTNYEEDCRSTWAFLEQSLGGC